MLSIFFNLPSYVSCILPASDFSLILLRILVHQSIWKLHDTIFLSIFYNISPFSVTEIFLDSATICRYNRHTKYNRLTDCKVISSFKEEQTNKSAFLYMDMGSLEIQSNAPIFPNDETRPFLLDGHILFHLLLY